jgi:hypothetical protein
MCCTLLARAKSGGLTVYPGLAGRKNHLDIHSDVTLLGGTTPNQWVRTVMLRFCDAIS